MAYIEIDDYGTYTIDNIVVPCPECGANMVIRPMENPSTITDFIAVIPIECPNCKYGSALNIQLEGAR